MDEQTFLKTMIETVKYDDAYKNRDELLGILRHSMITYRKTSDYTRVSNQRKEYLDKGTSSDVKNSKIIKKWIWKLGGNVQSVGIKNAVTINGTLSAEEFTYTFWDEYKKGNDWVVVSQSINAAATDFMNGRMSSYTSSYADGFKQIQLNEDTLAFIAERSHHEMSMYVDIWNAKKKEMVQLQISGYVGEDTIVQIAKSYLPTK
jgi:hypothetical protein